jgi:hypothetical protein
MPNYDDQEQDISWKKPAWATGTKLKSTGKGKQMMTEGNLASDITNAPHTKAEGEQNFSKPEWTGGVSESKVGDGNLAKPITNMPHGEGGTTGWEKPEWANSSSNSKVGDGNLAKPITNSPHGEGGTGWEKPAWAQSTNLKDTGGRGAALKSGKEIARPIGGIKPIES